MKYITTCSHHRSSAVNPAILFCICTDIGGQMYCNILGDSILPPNNLLRKSPKCRLIHSLYYGWLNPYDVVLPLGMISFIWRLTQLFKHPSPHIGGGSLPTSLIWLGGWIWQPLWKMFCKYSRLTPPDSESATSAPTSSSSSWGWSRLMANHLSCPREVDQLIWTTQRHLGFFHRLRIRSLLWTWPPLWIVILYSAPPSGRTFLCQGGFF